jgi:lysophospholipase L1-like esterase
LAPSIGVQSKTFTQDELDAEIDANLPTNNVGAIQAIDLRGVLHDMNAAIFQQAGVPPVIPAVPVITSPLTASGTVGAVFSYAITATNSPTSFNATGLPAGLSVSTTTGVISGTPTAAATSNVALSAANSGGTGNATLVLTIAAAVVGLPAGAVGYWVMSDYNSTNSNPVVPNRIAVNPPNQSLLHWSSRYIPFYGVASGVTITQRSAPGPDGSVTAVRLLCTGGWYVAVVPDQPFPTTGTYTMAFNYKANTGTQQFQAYDGYAPSNTTGTLTATSSWQRASFQFSGSGGGNRPAFASFDGATGADILLDHLEIYSGSSDLGPATTMDGHCYLGTDAFNSPKPTFASGVLDFSADAGALAVVRFPGTISATATLISIFKKTASSSRTIEGHISDVLDYNQFEFATERIGARMWAYGGAATFGSDSGMINLFGLGWNAVGLRVGASGVDEMLANGPTRHYPTSSSAYNFQDIVIGNVSSGASAPTGQIAAMALWPRALSDTEYATALSVLTGAATSVTMSPRRFYMAIGDSITRGYGTTNGGFPYLYVPAATPLLVGVNYGTDGYKLSDLQTLYTSYDLGACTRHKLSGEKNILSVLIGTNDLIFGFTGGSQSVFLTQYAAFLDQARTDGWYVIVGTIPSANASGGGAIEANIAPLNTEIRLWTTNGSAAPGKHADALCDFAAPGTHFALGSSNYADTTYYQSDQVHPTDAGQSALEAIIAPIINAV